MAFVLPRVLFTRAQCRLWSVPFTRGFADVPGAGATSGMKLTFAAPNGVYYNKAEVRQVDVPSQSGAFGILANHVPTLAVLSPGVVTVIETDGKTNKFFVSSGSITVNDDSSVQVLAEEAVPVEQLDTAACRDTLQWAQAQVSKGGSEEEKTEALIALQTAEALVKACEG